MRPSIGVPLAVAGTRSDRVRVAMTAFGAAAAVLSWLCAATVAKLGTAFAYKASNDRYSNALIAEPGLRPGVIATFTLLTIPVLALVAQSARLGAPARDPRIAAIRMAGATPRQAVAIGAGESGVSAGIGALLGLVAYVALHTLLNHRDRNGRLALPTDIWPPAWSIVVICTGLPILVALLSAWLLRRVVTSPMGVVRQERRRRSPRPWPGLLIVGGGVLFGGFGSFVRLLDRHHAHLSGQVVVALFYAGLISVCVGVVLGAGWIAYTAGRILRRYARRPAAQLAGARLVADPWQGSRTIGVLIIGTMFGAIAAGVYASVSANLRAQTISNRLDAIAINQPYVPNDDSFYTNAFVLVGIAIAIAVVVAALGLLASMADVIVSRRRTNAALVATGVPRSVLARTVAWQTFAVAIPAVLIATASGALIPRLLLGSAVDEPPTQATFVDGPPKYIPAIHVPIDIPWPQLALILGGSLGAVALTVGIGLLFLKASTSPEELRTT